MLTITNEDNMELMARYPDKHFDLAIVDPPYGIGASKFGSYGNSKIKYTTYKKSNWDSEIPNELYFRELFRVCKHQIIWGGNYFYLPPSGKWICWDKMQPDGVSFSPIELAWISNQDCKSSIFKKSACWNNGGNSRDSVAKKIKSRIHSTQKPIELYKHCLKKYAKTNDKILDTHLGSGSIAIACHDYGFDLTACELDTDYYNAAMKRINNHVSQVKMF